MDIVQAVFGLGALFVITLKVLCMYLAYRYSFKLEAQARERVERRRRLEAVLMSRKLEAEELERETATREALLNIRNSLRKNFEVVGAVLTAGAGAITDKLING